MNYQSKHQKIRFWLLSGHKLSGIQALKKFHVYRLAVVCSRLKKSGLNVVCDTSKGYGVYSIPL